MVIPVVSVAEEPWDAPDSLALLTSADSREGVVDAFFVARAPDGTAVGCGGLSRGPSHEAEVRQLYVVPDARGRGVATAVLAALEKYAREAGVTLLRAETGADQHDAMRFLAREGYGRVPAFDSAAVRFVHTIIDS